MSSRSLPLTQAQQSAFECRWGGGNPLGDSWDRLVDECWNGSRNLHVPLRPDLTVKLWEALNEASNAEDAFAQDPKNPAIDRAYARRAAKSLAVVAGKVLDCLPLSKPDDPEEETR